MTPEPHPHHPGFDDLDLDALHRRSGAKWSRVEDDAIAAWVADMDFPPCPAVADRLGGVLATGDLGYPGWWPGTPLRQAFADRMAARYGWEPDPAAVRECTDIIQALQLCLDLATRPGDGVALVVPSYPPFLHAISTMDRRLVPVPLTAEGGRWVLDVASLEREAATGGVRMLVLVNPHNPTGRVFTRDELGALADVARRHDLVVVSDEIHAELVHAPHEHVPFATLSDDAARRTVTLTSASKAFNLAGLRAAVMHLGAPELLAARDARPGELYGAVNNLGVHATLAAWSPDAEPWAATLLEHLGHTVRRLVAAAGTDLPGVRAIAPEGTYLVWFDVRDALPGDAAKRLLEHGLKVNPGTDFGPGGDGFVRVNAATSASVVEEIVRRIRAAIDAG